MHRCPHCRAPAKSREENPSFPFCSPRCRAVDLAKWFTGTYRFAGPPAESPPPPPPEGENDQ
jgi:endogenous inhibitor of DNA gyrase (YacG/DUF329 family)